MLSIYQYILSAVLYVWGSSYFGLAASYGVAIFVAIYPSSLKLLNLPYSGWLAMGLENPATSGSAGTFVSSKRLNFIYSIVIIVCFLRFLSPEKKKNY